MLTGNVSAGNTEAENTEATASSITEGTSYPDIQAMIGRKSTDNGIGPVAPSDIQMVNRGSYADGMEPTDLISDGITLSDAQNAAYIQFYNKAIEDISLRVANARKGENVNG